MKAKMIIMAVVAMMMASCHEFKASVEAKGPVATYDRPEVKDFEAIEITGSMSVIYEQSDKFKVSVTAPRDLLDRITTTSEGGVLKVGMKSNIFFFNVNNDDIVVRVSSPDLVGVSLKGSGDFTCNGMIDTDKMKVELRGSGDVDIKHLICDQLQVSLLGSGDVDMPNVTAINTDVNLMGSGDVEIGQHDVKNTNIALRGSGDVKMNLNNCGEIFTDIAGSGDVTLEGTAKQERHSVKGSGDIHTNRLVLR